MDNKSVVALDDGLDIQKVLTSGSVLRINEDYHDMETHLEPERIQVKSVEFIGEPVKSFEELEKQMTVIDPTGFVKKKIFEEGGGMPLHKGCTVYIVFSGYWEKEEEPFDYKKPDKPMIVDLNDNGLLPGLQMAVQSMLVGEYSVFLLSYHVMYGELGIPPRIKPKSDCVFYIKLVKSTLTPKDGPLDFSEPNTFPRVYHEVKLLYGAGTLVYKSKNYPEAVRLFRRAENMLHNCRLADEAEEEKQEKMLVKLYMNLAICHNLLKQPLKACIACNELNRLKRLWSNGKALFQNAKALRMIGDFESAQKKLSRAVKLCPDSLELQKEQEILDRAKATCNQSKLVTLTGTQEASDAFKNEVDNVVKSFKESMELYKLTIPASLNNAEIAYVKEACERENLFFNKVLKDYALDKEPENIPQEELQALL